MWPSVVSASKSGATSPSCKPIANLQSKNLQRGWPRDVAVFATFRVRPCVRSGSTVARSGGMPNLIPLPELKHAGDPRLIEGVSIYCDRWCDRCRFQDRCLLRTDERYREALIANG